jgi:polysaccharide export outer membrane protein
VLIVASEKISFLEALGLAGDLTIYARRDNVLLIREENGKKVLRRIDLNSSDLFKSPYYYLKSNDVIYVEPNTAKVAAAGRSQLLLPVIFSALSFAAIAIQVFK